METKETNIDAVAMTRRIRDAHHERLKNTTPEERIRFFREKARRVHASVSSLLSRGPSPDPA
jgi:hypothetical protein